MPKAAGKRTIMSLVLALIVMLLMLLITGCNTGEAKREFDFILSYGVLNKNIINTTNNSFTKDLVLDGVVTTELILTEEEKQEIYVKMKDINLFQYPEEVEGMNILPQSGFKFEIYMDGESKTINWKGAISESERDKEFRSLIEMIKEKIAAKEAYKSLPEAHGYYE
ncbi:hypothetical protein [Paenibacillus soyae]|uniref:Lipoprotein n=1 Tax=Paenibacillus soyae TaxID=2969249 RepID=A0A9X2SAT8_9BACL|nr:hypothetical protein [Paenibacillus soyae]MCR2806646.1 hypothetical protein [Paenibacillus soyae]